jgi:hypothetical protein
MTEPSFSSVATPERDDHVTANCPSCGTPFEPSQEYCLECGARLPTNQGLVGVLAAGWQRHLRWYPGDWIWPALALLALAIVATVIVVVFGGNDSESANPVVATNVSVPLGPGRVSNTVPTVATGTEPLPTAPEATVPEQPPSKPRPRPANAPAVWPAGKSGYTVVLESIPTSSGRAAALQRAKEARARGLKQVGVIDSSNFSSFHPGFFVVFAGIYGSYTDASDALSNAHSHGFPDAYPRQVTR